MIGEVLQKFRFIRQIFYRPIIDHVARNGSGPTINLPVPFHQTLGNQWPIYTTIVWTSGNPASIKPGFHQQIQKQFTQFQNLGKRLNWLKTAVAFF